VAKLALGSSVSIEALEQFWQTIVKGIEETKAIQDEMRQTITWDKGVFCKTFFMIRGLYRI